jgi:hypothetical protein
MKNTFLLSLLLPLAAFGKCPDFSGKYRWSDDSNFIQLDVRQIQCEQSYMEYDAGWGFTIKHKHYFDGRRRLVEDNGDFQAYETAMIDENGMRIQEDRHNFDEDGKPHTYFVEFKISLTPAGDLSIFKETFNQEQVSIDKEEYLYKKIQ